MQATLAKAVEFQGVGVHSGRRATLTVNPAPADAGVVFRRIDLAGDATSFDEVSVPAAYDAVADTRLCTVIANAAGVSVGTIEHVMAALAGVGVSNAIIDVDGPEVPIMDGSSEPFVRGFLAAGIARQDAPRKAIKVLKRIEARVGEAAASLSPSERFEIDFRIDFADAAIGRQARAMTMVNGAFVDSLCAARTFGRLCDVEALRAAGLARGGSLENAIVVDGDRVLNPEGLRFDDEFVRHKMLDAVGDLSLAGAPIVGRYEGVRAGHDVTNKLLRALFADPTAFAWVDGVGAPLGVAPAIAGEIKVGRRAA